MNPIGDDILFVAIADYKRFRNLIFLPTLRTVEKFFLINSQLCEAFR